MNMADKHRYFGFLCITLVTGLLLCLGATASRATNSTNYQIQEDFVGGGGNTSSSSSSFNSQDAIGGAAAGSGAGTNYLAQSGVPTTAEPTLTFSVNTSSVSRGSLSTSITRTGTATFNVLNYTSYGYVVQIIGNTPSNGAHNLTNLSSPTASSTNTEQFGINLVANTAPATFGANPTQVPDSSFSFGSAASGYDTANTYKYVSGNTIASATKSSGQTTYTISYIANISNNTPGGSYSSNQVIVCTGTY